VNAKRIQLKLIIVSKNWESRTGRARLLRNREGEAPAEPGGRGSCRAVRERLPLVWLGGSLALPIATSFETLPGRSPEILLLFLDRGNVILRIEATRRLSL